MTPPALFPSTFVLAALTFATMCSLACGGDNTCVNGESQACACPTGEVGAQVCAEGAFNMCVCAGGVDAGAQDGAAQDGGIDADPFRPDSMVDASGNDASPGMDAATPVAMCIGDALECRHMPRDGCDAQLGCIYDDFSGCTGMRTSCDSFAGTSTCDAQRGCQWETPSGARGLCIGDSLECRHMPREGCDEALGCIYDDFSGCVGTHTSCDDFLSTPTCDAERGCQWETPSGAGGMCIGDALECRHMPRATCNDQLGCIYDDFSGCVGTRTSCDRFAGTTTCGAQRGCQWETPSSASGMCIGDSLECRHMPRETCDDQLGCIYDDFSGCVGTHTSCDDFAGTPTCDAQRGCQWETPTTASGMCIGSALECRRMPRDGCDDQLGCIYDSFSGCVGTGTSCDSFEGSTTCGAQRGCLWE